MNTKLGADETTYTAVFEKATKAPASNAKATETLTLHKILMNKDNLSEGVFPGWTGLNGEKYNGNKIEDIQKYFGTSAKGAEGVFFALKFAADYPDKTKAGKYVKAKTELGEIIHDKPAYDLSVVDGKVVAVPQATDKIDEAVSGLTDANGEIKFYTRENKINAIANPNYDANDPESRAKLNAICYLDGKFEIDEIVEKSTYNNGGKVLTDSKAVPVKITLPLVNEEGVVVDAHVYPKNTDNAPRLDKNFSLDEAKKFMTTKEAEALDAAVAHKIAFDKAEKIYSKDSTEYEVAQKAYTDADKALIAKWGIDLSNPTREKQTVDHKIGDIVEYKVETEIPAKTKWGTAFWDDKMTHGLTFVTKDMDKAGTKYEGKSIVIKYNDEVMDTAWYTLSETQDGFTLELTEAGLKAINGKEEEAKITLTYSAEINNTTVTDIPESNDITFNYGNDKNKGNTPVPVKPNDDGNYEVIKKWADGTELPEDGIDVTFTLKDAQTGKEVTKKDLVAPSRDNFNTDEEYEDAVKEFEAYRDGTGDYAEGGSKEGQGFQNPVTKEKVTKTDDITFTWKYLDKNRQYKAEEKFIGYAAKYEKTPGKGDNQQYKDGSVTVTNTKTNNPEPLNPSEPKVITGGRKFVKTNDKEGQDLERLAGAKFLVTKKENNVTKYLTLKPADEINEEYKKYTDAENAYNDFIAAFNKIVEEAKAEGKGVQYPVTINDQPYNDRAAVEAELETLRTTRDDAFKAARQNYDWIEAKDEKEAVEKGALVLTSDDQGRFEITGLAYGDYELVEIEAPKGYAKIDPVPFTIGKDTYKGDAEKELRYTLDIEAEAGTELTEEQKKANAKALKEGYGLRVRNKIVKIPETGGIGTVIFTVAGLLIMGGALVLMRRNRREEF